MRTIEMKVTEAGFEPNEVHVQAGEAVRLDIKRVAARTCATSIESPGLLAKTRLPLGEKVSVEFTPCDSGSFRFGCSMQMHIGGTLVVAR
ncbi:MAG: cupredoxin domain-containing protein [Archangium sp.]|nr:cupredoxin domain-containing protein [Archangium sp.]